MNISPNPARILTAGRLFVLLILTAFFGSLTPAGRAETFADWATSFGLTGDDALPTGNPDGDPYINALEYAFASNPKVPDLISQNGPSLTVLSNQLMFAYRVSTQALGVATYRVVQATNLVSPVWIDVSGPPIVKPVAPDYSVYYQPVDTNGPQHYFRLEVTVPFTPEFAVKVLVGTGVGSNTWDGMPIISQVWIRQQEPNIAVITTNGNVITTNNVPNLSKYPEVVGTSLFAATPDLQNDSSNGGPRLRRRSWMGWFGWANGTPPPGISPGYPTTGTYDTNSPWDFFSYQFSAKSTNIVRDGAWTPVRLDQQPLYLNPFRLNYAWPPGQFGYVSQPLKPFPNDAHYWSNKRIVRGPNLSFANPYFVQYGDRVSGGDMPDEWRDSWFFMRTRPLETLIITPSNLKPTTVLNNGTWNLTAGGTNDPFPYPVWVTNLPASEQTPFEMQVDRMGDWDADVIWEATHPGAIGYSTNRYHRTAFNQAGQGNYLKMTVAQGSPFIWCETRGNRYVNFYNLIRQNLTNSIASNNGTDAKMVPGGPWPVPGVSGVNYVLFYGDHNNPNQWYHETAPTFYTATNAMPGGFNPPGMQHNFTYVAVFYRTNSVQPVTLGSGGTGATENNGTDAQGNPYFYLEFKNTAKNWFVVGSVPVMHYYHTGVTVDSEATRITAARDWADNMGKYAFNFVTGTKVTYASSNMYLVTTTYTNTVRNPFVAAGDSSASGMTPNSVETVMALLPHQYQNFILGPDLTQADKSPVIWHPLKTYGTDLPIQNPPPNANKSNPTATSHWGYWGPRGNMKPIITASFVTQYPFQNFLPVYPPPNLATNYVESGIQVLRITDVGTGNHIVTNIPTATIHTATDTNGSGATFEVIPEPFTGRIQQVNVTSPGSGYPDGLPPNTNIVWLTIDPPAIPPANGGRQATARLQIGGGKVLAVFMNDKGAGYQSTISVTQSNVTYDAPIIVPPFDGGGNLALGNATIIAGGAGFDFSNTNNPPVIQVIGTGTGAKAQIVGPGEIYQVGDSGIGGFSVPGVYPSSGDLVADAARIQASLPPLTPNGKAQQVVVQSVIPSGNILPAITDQGNYGSTPSAYYIDESNSVIALSVAMDGSKVINIFPTAAPGIIVTPKPVVFTNGEPVTRQAQAWLYAGVKVGTLSIAGPTVAGYSGSPQVSFTGGDLLPPNVTLPQIGYHILTNGTVSPNLTVINPGTGWNYGTQARIDGGRGFDAAAVAVTDPNGSILAIKVLRQGNNYPSTNVYLTLTDLPNHPTTPGSFGVVVNQGKIVSIVVTNGGIGYSNPVVSFSSMPNGDSAAFPAKGPQAIIQIFSDGAGSITNATLLNPGANYVAGTETNDVPSSPKTSLVYDKLIPIPFAKATPQARGYLASAISPNLSINQVLYDNIIMQYKNFASDSLRPFGGGFGGNAAPDGYGLGNQLSSAAKFAGVLYNYQQLFAAVGKDQPDIPPGQSAFNDGNASAVVYELPIYRANQPMLTLSGGLESSVQGLERTLSLLHTDPPTHNTPLAGDWFMEYFTAYDTKAGRIVINPTATIPVQGVVSTTINPPSISDAENADKTGLKRWQRGMLWSGFGVSDQWNDQHYFYGYYLGTAGLLSILDQSWKTNIVSKPGSLWANPDQMGTAIDQWVMTLAYDPDNVPLVNSLYRKSEFTYQKFAFFDQWNGHGWATGVSPGRAGDVEDGKFGALVPWSIWLSHGTGTGPYDDENENSIWEGLQPFSAITLWGGGTDRKPLVDLGMYLLATGNTAGDMYFHDKNYNMPNTASNKLSWVPVTTVNSSAVPNNGGNNSTPANSGMVETVNPAFYTAPTAFGGQGSAGSSILHKGSPSLNNFFYAFPTGSKFIQSFPPSPWTLGMTRNSDYMKRWAGSMMRQEWLDARNTSLFQAANWLSMAMASAVSGVPYNPGDIPYATNSLVLLSNAPQPYVDRIWSSWVTVNGPAGAQAAKQPTFTAIEVLDFFHVLDTYGTPDWTYIGKATTSSGTADNNSIVFTASFSKQISANTVRTTFVAFNPGWQTRYASFYRIAVTGAIGTTPVAPELPLTIGAKRMALLTKDFPIN